MALVCRKVYFMELRYQKLLQNEFRYHVTSLGHCQNSVNLRRCLCSKTFFFENYVLKAIFNYRLRLNLPARCKIFVTKNKQPLLLKMISKPLKVGKPFVQPLQKPSYHKIMILLSVYQAF